MEGKIPKEWQNSKVVFIPKPNRDLALLKAWRPITLINCIGKLGEKVVADELQQAGLPHRHQFGGVKGRSAIDAVFREVTRVQRCLSAGGKAAEAATTTRPGRPPGGSQQLRLPPRR